MVHRQLFALTAIILPRLFLHLTDSVLQGQEYGFSAQEGRTTGLTISPSMAGMYLEMPNLKNCHSSKYSVVDLAFRTARILPFSLIRAQVLLLILTRLCSRQRPVLLSAFLHSWYVQSIKLGPSPLVQ